jgi:hypothetical protein
MEYWPLLENPKGNVYRRLMQVLCANSDRFYFITHRDFDYNHAILEEFKPYCIEICRTNKWGSTQYGGAAPTIYIIEAKQYTCKLLQDSADSLYDWNYPLPEDLTFLKNGYTWFVSISHEKVGGFYIYTDHQRDLLKQIPGIIIEKAEIDYKKPYFIDTY